MQDMMAAFEADVTEALICPVPEVS